MAISFSTFLFFWIFIEFGILDPFYLLQETLDEYKKKHIIFKSIILGYLRIWKFKHFGKCVYRSFRQFVFTFLRFRSIPLGSINVFNKIFSRSIEYVPNCLTHNYMDHKMFCMVVLSLKPFINITARYTLHGDLLNGILLACT